MKSAAKIETWEIARHDGRGRRLAAAGEREALIAAYRASGLIRRLNNAGGTTSTSKVVSSPIQWPRKGVHPRGRTFSASALLAVRTDWRFKGHVSVLGGTTDGWHVVDS